jgi:cytochrome c oxidase assembly factor CtaG
MPSPIHAAFESWSIPLPVTLLLAVTALLYLRGWLRLRSASTTPVYSWHLGAFIAGLATLWMAVGSPLVTLDDGLLTIHMIQHVLLMAVAPPLILLGAPALPLLHGLPQRFVRGTLGPTLRWPPIQKFGHTLTHPAVCWLAAMGGLGGMAHSGSIRAGAAVRCVA